MEWVLNDPDHGAYGSGRLIPGKHGDFATSPSLGNEFSCILAIQVNQWIKQLIKDQPKAKVLSLVELGPGKGDMALDLVSELCRISPQIINRLELVLVEPNKGMVDKQKEKLLNIFNIPIRWSSIEELKNHPITGIVIANEMLDALPVERIVWRDKHLFRQGVKIENNPTSNDLSFCELPLSFRLTKVLNELEENISIKIPPLEAPNEWNTEINVSIESWFQDLSVILESGPLLIIDYMLKANSYYSPKRNNGTALAYKSQIASSNLLFEPGFWDITSHLCIEMLEYYSQKYGFKVLGHVRQGEALLSLGLANRLNSLRNLPKDQLHIALERREHLLRLVDPLCLGEFRWMALQKSDSNNSKHNNLKTNFLEFPD